MKTLNKISYIIVLIVISSGLVLAQNQNSNNKLPKSRTETFKVLGNCEMCKTRIEKAAKIEGVLKAEWNQSTKIFTLVYDPSKVKSDDIQKKIAAVGHDTEKYKAEDKTYKSLPGCCQYKRKN